MNCDLNILEDILDDVNFFWLKMNVGIIEFFEEYLIVGEVIFININWEYFLEEWFCFFI